MELVGKFPQCSGSGDGIRIRCVLDDDEHAARTIENRRKPCQPNLGGESSAHQVLSQSEEWNGLFRGTNGSGHRVYLLPSAQISNFGFRIYQRGGEPLGGLKFIARVRARSLNEEEIPKSECLTPNRGQKAQVTRPFPAQSNPKFEIRNSAAVRWG